MLLQKDKDKPKLRGRIKEILATTPEVRPFPAAVTRLLAACQDPNAGGAVFESIIECDPGLSLRLLRLANSPLFCPVGQVNSIAHATSLLGLRKLKSLAVSIAGASMFGAGEVAQQQRQQLWTHSLGCAAVARALSEHVPDLNAEDAFLAGVFHDVGKLFFLDFIPDEYREIQDAYAGRELIEHEATLLGTTHEEVGLTSAHSWDLPKEIKAAIGWHHRPDQATVYPEIAAGIGFADRLARNWAIGSATVLDPDLQIEVGDRYHLTEEQLETMRVQTNESYDGLLVICS